MHYLPFILSLILSSGVYGGNIHVSAANGFKPDVARNTGKYHAAHNAALLQDLLTGELKDGVVQAFRITFDMEEKFFFGQVELDQDVANYSIDLTGANLVLWDGPHTALFLVKGAKDLGKYAITGLPRRIVCQSAENQSFVAAASSRDYVRTRIDNSIVDLSGAMVYTSGYPVDYRGIDYSRMVTVRNMQSKGGMIYVSGSRADHHAISQSDFSGLRTYSNSLYAGAAFHFSGVRGGTVRNIIAEGLGKVDPNHRVLDTDYTEVVSLDLNRGDTLPSDGDYLIYHFTGRVNGGFYRKHEVYLQMRADTILHLQKAITRATAVLIEGAGGNPQLDGIWVEQVASELSDKYTMKSGETGFKGWENSTAYIYIDNLVAPITQYIENIDVRVHHGGSNMRREHSRAFLTARGGTLNRVFVTLHGYDNPSPYALKTIGKASILCQNPTYRDEKLYQAMLQDPTFGGRANITLDNPRFIK